MSSVSHAVCVEGSCALVKADWPQSYIYIHYKLFDTVSKNTPVEDGVCYVLLTWVRLCLHAPLFKNGISSCRKLDIPFLKNGAHRHTWTQVSNT